MKAIYFFIGVSLFSIKLFAQDTLYTVAGEKICAKVTEITDTELKYKKTSNLDGPTYVVNKNSIALIEYKNGTKEVLGTGVASAENPEQITRNNTVINNYDNGGFYGWWPRVRVAWAAPIIINGFGNYYRPYRYIYRGHRHHHYHHRYSKGRYR